MAPRCDYFYLTEIDKCSDPDLNNCDPVGGQCIGAGNSYTCACKEGYTGDGITCTGRFDICCNRFL